MDINDTQKRITDLEAKKTELINELLGVFRRLRHKGYEIKAIMPYLVENDDIRAGPLRRKIDEIEFRIATEAYTPAHEKDFIKAMKGVEQELGEAIKVEKVRKRKGYIESDLKKAEDDKTRIEVELTKIRTELKALRDGMWQAREDDRNKRYEDGIRKRKQDVRNRAKQELAPFMKPLERLSLEDVVLIERKTKKSEASES